MSMSKSSIEYIRRAKAAEAKINKVITYAGHPYRIAWADGDALILRSELRVHPRDNSINYNPSEVDLVIGSQSRRLKTLEDQLKKAVDELHAYHEAYGDSCPFCDGAGGIAVGWSYDDNAAVEQICPHCKGTGKYQSQFQNGSGITEPMEEV
jgi:hypothetical protein